VRILGSSDPFWRAATEKYQQGLSDTVRDKDERVRAEFER